MRSPTRPRRMIRSTAICRRAGRWREWEARRASDPKGVERAAKESMAVHVRAMLEFWRRGVPDVRLRQQHPPDGEGDGRRRCVRFPRLRAGLYPPAVLPRHRPVPLGGAVGRPRGHLPHRRQGEGADAGRRAPAQLAGHGEVAHQVPGPARAHLLGRARRPPPAGARVQRDGGAGRAEGADRDRPRSSRFRLGGEPQPRDRRR